MPPRERWCPKAACSTNTMKTKPQNKALVQTQDHDNDEAWIDHLIEPIREASNAPLLIPPLQEPDEEFLTRCRQTALHAWSLHRLKAEARRTPVEAITLTAWLLMLAGRAGVALADAMSLFAPQQAASFSQWPADSLGRFLAAIGLDPVKTRVLLGLEWFQCQTAACGGPPMGRRDGKHDASAPGFREADEELTRKRDALPAHDRAKFCQWLDGVSAAMAPSQS